MTNPILELVREFAPLAEKMDAAEESEEGLFLEFEELVLLGNFIDAVIDTAEQIKAEAGK